MGHRDQWPTTENGQLGPTVSDKGVGHTLSYRKEQSFQQELVPYFTPYTKLTQNCSQPNCKSSEAKAPKKQSEKPLCLGIRQRVLR